MTRELRLGAAGILFYLVFAFNLLATRASQDLLGIMSSSSQTTSSQITSADIYQGVTAVVGVGALLFTSDSIGYLFGSFYIFYWNDVRGRFQKGKGGYSAEWRKLSYDIKTYVIEQYKIARKTSDKDALHSKFEEQWESYSADVFLAYFWQRAPRDIVDWGVRRHTAFFTGMSTIIGICFGLILSVTIIMVSKMGWTAINTGITVAAAILILMIYSNAEHARSEAWQIIDLWLANAFNPHLAPILNQVQQSTGVAPFKKERAEKQG
jgi:hypothetical protein